MENLTEEERVEYAAFVAHLQSQSHLDIPEFKALVKREFRKLSPNVQYHVYDFLLDKVVGDGD